MNYVLYNDSLMSKNRNKLHVDNSKFCRSISWGNKKLYMCKSILANDVS